MDFHSELTKTGFALYPDLLETGLVDRLREESMMALEIEKNYFHTSGTTEEGRVLFGPRYGSCLVSILDNEIINSVFEEVLGEFILYTMTTSFIPPGQKNKTSEIHRDARHNIHSPVVDMAVMILLDDFTEQNGCTYFLAGSHHTEEKPVEALFYQEASRITAPKGSLCFFNPLIWHASGTNQTEHLRGCLLIEMIKPWMKQRFDISKILPENIQADLSPHQRKILGLDHQPPGSYEAYFEKKN